MRKKIAYLAICSVVLAGCAAKLETNVPTTDYKKEIEEYHKRTAPKSPTASLWTDIGNSNALFLDYKGRTIGDIVIVKIIESSSATNSNSTSTSKNSKYDMGITSMLGLPLNMGITDFLGKGQPFVPEIKEDTKNSFSGSGKKQKSDKVTATMAARVIDILASGNLVIEGQREIVVDQEKQVITVKGIIRQKDIDADNTVLSTSIADAQISYSGKGIISDSNKKGWLSNIIDWVWPF
ncbi:MAG: flagellar basal body L-ring protein FlgH [Calditerrivibrio sp.]|nr:flagellar basal body L-ring protein FlgH [Calditerrivibrio sp.]MCA1980071.1 flagellar basal body L-ring protein FlgH [Calditerrivibrio sp.]